MIKLKDFPKELEKQLQTVLDEITSPKSMQQIGDELADQIRVRTRLGQGLDESQGEPSKLKPLSPGYKELRKRLNLSGLTTPNKSNLTQTGQMLDELVAKVSGEKITITFKTQESKDKARWNSEMGREFLNISRVQVERLTNNLNSKIQKILKNLLN